MSERGSEDQQKRLDPSGLDLNERCAVLTGAGSGMAASIASYLAAAGVKLVLADVDEVSLARTTEKLRSQGALVHPVPTDVTSVEQVDALMHEAMSRYRRLDILVNLAAIIHDAPVLETDPDDLERLLAVNVRGTFLACRAAARHMVERESGCIINLASLAAFNPIPHLSSYGMSKAAVVALTRTLAAEVGRHGVRVNAVAPGFIEGGMTLRNLRHEDGSIDQEGREELLTRIRRRNPLRITGEPGDVAQVILFLVSDASRYITGQVIHTNGGSYMP